MTLPIYASETHPYPHLRAARVLLVAALGLFAHAITHPGQPASISRASGRVAPR
ncbi:MAG: hypothetical protein ABIP13_04140 [Tepidiformaceae bacterium]